MKYLIEVIIVFWIIRMGMRFLDSMFKQPNNVGPTNQQNPVNDWQGARTSTTAKPVSKDDDYIDYEEVK